MEALQLLLNDQLVTITGDPTTIKRLNEDDQFLQNYVNRAAKAGQFHFLFTKDPSLRRIVVKRIPTFLIPVWDDSEVSNESDTSATLLLLKLRNSENFVRRFKDDYCSRSKLWDEIANEMRMAGFDVDAQKCEQKFLHLLKNYQKKNDFTPELCFEMRKIFGNVIDNTAEEEDDDWLPNSTKKRRRNCNEDDEDTFKKYLKKDIELKQKRFNEIRTIIKRRNELLERKLQQNREFITILKRFVQS